MDPARANQPIFEMYLFYVVLSVAITVWVAMTLKRNGRIFLVDVFRGNEPFADAVNSLLVVGFYLVNLGWISLTLRTRESVISSSDAVEVLSWKLGMVLLALGGMHFFNMLVLAKCRSRSLAEAAYEASRNRGLPATVGSGAASAIAYADAPRLAHLVQQPAPPVSAPPSQGA